MRYAFNVWRFYMRCFAVAFMMLLMAMFMPVGASLSLDLTNAYVWRGDERAGPSLQPSLSILGDPIELVAWGNYGIDGGADEVNVSARCPVAPGLTVSLTDYYATGDFFDVTDDGPHSIELGAVYESRRVTVSVGYLLQVAGSDTHPVWAQLTVDDVVGGAGLIVGAGDGIYTMDGEASLVLVGMTVARDEGAVSFLVNVDSKEAWLVGRVDLL